MINQEQTYIEVFKKCASTFSEAMHIPISTNSAITNVFGRNVEMHSSGGLSLLLGKAVSGLRCSALLNANQLKSELNVISTFNRMHVPLSVVIYNGGAAFISQIRQTGAILFSVNTVQELSDWLFIGQVIAEKCLTPVVIISESIDEDELFDFPNSKELRQWFGNPDDRVLEPIASQEMVLGTARRRMPAWLHIDQAVLMGANKQPKMKALEMAANQQFEQEHYPSLIESTLQDYYKLFGRKHFSFEEIGHKKPKNILISTSLSTEVERDSVLRKLLEKKQAKLVILNQLNPLPVLNDFVENSVLRIGILEAFSDSVIQGQLYAAICAQDLKTARYTENGWFANNLSYSSIEASLNHLINKESKSTRYWLDVPLINSKSEFPKHEILLQQIKRDYPKLENVSVQSEHKQDSSLKAVPSVPSFIRKFKNQGPPYAKISRFYDDTFCLHEYAKNEIIADPFQAYPVMPIASASFKNNANGRALVPVFKPKLCKEIDELILSCNYGALPSALYTVQILIESGIKHARKQGEIIAQVTPVLKKWEKSSITYILENRNEISSLKDFLIPSFQQVIATQKLDDEKKMVLQNEGDAIVAAIGEIKVVVDQKLFVEQERRETGTGELFSIAVNTMACTECGHCALAGEIPCMSMEPQEHQLQKVEADFHHFEKLPETSDYSIRRLIENDDFDPFAALLINSKLYYSLSSSSQVEMSQDETILKYYLALVEFVSRPKIDDNVNAINTTIEKLNSGIKELLSSSLPVNQLDALMDVLDRHEESRVNTTQIFQEWGTEIKFNSIEKSKLERKIHVLEELKILKALLKTGISGQGRPSCTMVLDKSLVKLANYPYNPFIAPVLVSESADTASLTLGVCEGQMRHGLDQIRLRRRAELEALDRYSSSKHDEELANLSWKDLSIEEKQSLAPVLLFATNDWFDNCSQSRLSELLQASYPVKIFIIDKGIAEGNLTSQMQASTNSIWSAVADRNTFITRATLANRDNLYKKLIRSLTYQGNSIVNVFVPDWRLYDIHPSNWMQLSALADSTRAYLKWTFEPENPSASLATKLTTDIQEIDQDYQIVELAYLEEGNSKKIDYPMSWADWAYMAHNLKQFFTLAEKTTNTLLVSDYLKLSIQERASKIPVIIRVNEQGELQYYAVGAMIVDVCEVCLDNLKTLREWAGLYTEFPEKLKSQLNEELKEEYEQKRIDFEKEVNAQVAEKEANYLAEIKAKMKEKLLNMSGM